MATTSDARKERYRLFAVAASSIVAVVGVLVLFGGWVLDLEFLRSPFATGDPMVATTAFCFALTGFAGLLVARSDTESGQRLIVTVICIMVAMVSAVVLYGYTRGQPWLPFENVLALRAQASTRQMAPNTALAFLLLSMAMGTIDNRRRWVSVTSTMLSLLIGFIATAGHVLGVEGLYGFGDFTGMAIHSALCFVLLSLGLLAARPEREPVVRLTWSDSGGTAARMLIPLAAVLFVATSLVMSWLTDRRGGLIPSEAVLLENVLESMVLLALVWYLAGTIHVSEMKRKAVTDQTLRDKDRFMASVGHELRTPVTAVVGFAELLSEMGADLPEDERHKILEMMASQGSELVALLEDLLVAARTDTGSLSVASVRVNLRAQVAQAVEGLVGQAKPVEVSAGPEVFAVGDPLRTRQIVRNLITNAQRYGGDRIRVEVRSEEGLGLVRVCDDGNGIRSEDQAMIFEPYVTLHGDAGRPGSVGLGLPVARGLAIRMGGELAYRREAHWAVFELSIPLFVEPEAAVAEGSSPVRDVTEPLTV